MANAFETLKNISKKDNEGIYMKSDSTLVDRIVKPTQTQNRLPDPRSDEFMNIIEGILRARSSSVAYMTTSAFGTMSGMENPNDLSQPKNPYINI